MHHAGAGGRWDSHPSQTWRQRQREKVPPECETKSKMCQQKIPLLVVETFRYINISISVSILAASLANGPKSGFGFFQTFLQIWSNVYTGPMQLRLGIPAPVGPFCAWEQPETIDKICKKMAVAACSHCYSWHHSGQSIFDDLWVVFSCHSLHFGRHFGRLCRCSLDFKTWNNWSIASHPQYGDILRPLHWHTSTNASCGTCHDTGKIIENHPISTGLDIAGSATSRDATPRRWKEGASVKSELHSSLVASPLDNVDGDGEPSLVAATILLWSLMDIADIAWPSSFTTVSLSSLWSGEASLSSLSIKLHGINSVVEVWLSLKVRLLVLTNSIPEVLVLVEELVVVRVVVIVVTELVELELVDSVVVSLTVLVLVLLVVLVVEVSVVEVTVWVVELLVKVHDWDVVVETDTVEVDVVEVAWVCRVTVAYVPEKSTYIQCILPKANAGSAHTGTNPIHYLSLNFVTGYCTFHDTHFGYFDGFTTAIT